MEVLLLILLIAVIAASNIVCFVVGAKVGQKVSNDEIITMPAVNPLEAVREQKARKEAEMEQSKYDTILRNIENYDGTSVGQEDVLRG